MSFPFEELPLEIQEEIIRRATIPAQRAFFSTSRRIGQELDIERYRQQWRIRKEIEESYQRENTLVQRIGIIGKGVNQPTIISDELSNAIHCIPLYSGRPIASRNLISNWLIMYLAMIREEDEVNRIDETLSALTGYPIGSVLSFMEILQALIGRHFGPEINVDTDTLKQITYLTYYYRIGIREVDAAFLRQGLIYAC